VKLGVYFGGLCAVLDKCLDFLQLILAPSLKSGRVVEDELRVRLKGEWAIDIMDTALNEDEDEIVEISEQKPITAEVGSS
jgi:hypothetical protein